MATVTSPGDCTTTQAGPIVCVEKFPQLSNPIHPSKPCIPPGGSEGAGGATAGQLLPIGMRW